MAVAENVSIAFLLVGSGITTYPAVQTLLDQGKCWSALHTESQQANYEDKDGRATQESLGQYRARCHPRFILTLACLGNGISFVSAILDTVSCRRFVLSMSLSGLWLFASFLAVAYMLERRPRRRFTLANSLSLSAGFVLLGQIVTALGPECVSSHEGVSELAVRRSSIILQCFTAGAMLLLSVSNPRRPRLVFGGSAVDDQYTVSLSQRLSFAWLSPILRHARLASTSLNLVDLPIVHEALRAESLYRHFVSFGNQRVLWKRILSCHRWVIVGHYSLAILQCGTQLLPQWVLYQLLQYLEQRSLGSSVGNSIWLWAAFMGVSEFLASWLDTQLLWIVDTRIVIPLRSELTALIFAKVLAKKDLRQAPKVLQPTKTSLAGSRNNVSDSTAGDEATDDAGCLADCQESNQDTINLVSLDTKRVTNFMSVSFLVPATITKLSVSTAFLLYLIGWKSLLTGFVVLLLLTPLNIYCSRAMNAAQLNLMRVRDSKTSLVNEALQGIRQIKFTAAEGRWLQEIGEKRHEELRIQFYCFILRAVLVGLYQIGPILSSAISLVTYALFNGSLSPSIAFTTIAIFSQVEFSFGIVPKLIVQMLQAGVSTQRIQRFLESADQAQYLSRSQSDGDLLLRAASFTWPTESKKPDLEFRLEDLNIRFPTGKLSVISGDTGSGKSLLLSALVEEADHLSGTVSLPKLESDLRTNDWMNTARFSCSDMAFVSQNAWIENASIRSNILFGLPFCQDRYDEVIFACALTKDLAMMTDGDATEVGVSGVNLSGGQKWRLSFARALYSRASILIIDDIFSAVDAHVGLHMYNNALTGSLAKSRTRILATHHVDLCLARAQCFFRLDRGRILEQKPTLANFPEGPEEDPKDIEHNFSIPVDSPSKVGGRREDATSNLEDGQQLASMPKKYVEEESRQVGAVKFQTYRSYLAATGGSLMFVLIICAHLSYTGSIMGRSWWLSIWTRHTEESSSDRGKSTSALLQSILRQEHHYHHGLEFHETAANNQLKFYLKFYVLISLSVCLATILKYCSVITGSIKASRRLFEKFAWTIFHAPTHWFDTVPSGRILNRFTADFESIDSSIADGISLLLTIVLQLVAVIVAGVVVSPLLVVVAAVLIISSFHRAKLFLPAARDVKRLESVTRSPVLEHFQSTAAGVATIRAYVQAHIHMARMMDKLDDYAKTTYYRDLCNFWLTFRLSLIGAIFTTFVAAFIVARQDIDASLAGFALSFALQYTEAVEWTIRLFSSTQLAMNSTERVLEYSNMEIETQHGKPVSAAWPVRGEVSIQELFIRYRSGETVLKGISMHIEPGERVGIVGRTGAGKSTLSLALFRLLEAASGAIFIDGVDIAAIRLEDLRSRMAIISQDPVLFGGTIRSNLDPTKENSDSELYDALEQVHFTTSVGSENSSERSDQSRTNGIADLLSKPISNGGRNLSQGQRQLLCLARAVISRPKILVMDEATSSIDMKTDAAIQASIRRCFAASTLIVIAHRLSTLADFDKIFVLDTGKVVEHGSPRDLLLRKGAFWNLVQESGEKGVLEERILSSAGA